MARDVIVFENDHGDSDRAEEDSGTSNVQLDKLKAAPVDVFDKIPNLSNNQDDDAPVGENLAEEGKELSIDEPEPAEWRCPGRPKKVYTGLLGRPRKQYNMFNGMYAA